MTFSRVEHFGRVASTQGIVRDWLDGGTPEVCVAVADEQTDGRGRLDRRWHASPGRALLLSAGFRPGDIAAGRAWRLAAVVAMAMCRAAAEESAIRPGELCLKWPNDIVVRQGDRLLKVAGVLAEGVPGPSGMDTVIVGIGINVDWPRSEFPPETAGSMTSLAEVAGRPVARDALFERFLTHAANGYIALRHDHFDASAWAGAQVTTGARVSVDLGQWVIDGIAEGVDIETGALMLREHVDAPLRAVSHGDVVRCRVDELGSGV